jgi:hypothetical protein
MPQFNSSDVMKGFIKDLMKPKSNDNMKDVHEALSRGLGRKSPDYKYLKQETTVKTCQEDGNKVILKDGSIWEAKMNRGWNQEHAKYWDKGQPVIVTQWDELNDDYIMANLKMNDKSCWVHKGQEVVKEGQK